MKKINVDWNKIEEMRSNDCTWQQISDEIGIHHDTLRKRAYKKNMQIKKTYQSGKKRCDKCRKYFNRNDLKISRHGVFCGECFVW